MKLESFEYITKPAPVDQTSLEKWESFFKVHIPCDLLQLFKEFDGPILYDSKRNAEFQFLSAIDAIDFYDCFEFEIYMVNAIPICMDGNGNFAVYKRESEPPYGIHVVSASDLGWHSAVEIGNNLNELLSIRIEDRLYDE